MQRQNAPGLSCPNQKNDPEKASIEQKSPSGEIWQGTCSIHLPDSCITAWRRSLYKTIRLLLSLGGLCTFAHSIRLIFKIQLQTASEHYLAVQECSQ